MSTPVYTQTVESLLGGISDAISQLVVIQDTAERNNSILPDLTGAAGNVANALLNLAKEAQSLSESTADDQVKIDLEKACVIANKACNDLITSTTSLKSSPTDRAAAKLLVEGCRGVLRGTADLLDAFDMSDVRNIVNNAMGVSDQLDNLKLINLDEEFVEFARVVNSDLVAFAQIVSEREQVLTLPKLKQEIRDSNDVIRKESPPLMLATRLAYRNKGNPDAQKTRDDAIGRVKAAIREIIRLVQLKYYGTDLAPGQVASHFANIQSEFARLAALPGEAKAQLATGGSLAQSIDFAIQQAQDFAKNTTNPQLKASVLGSIARVQALRDEMKQVAEKLAVNPNDVAARKRYDELVELLPKEISLIEKAMNDDAIQATTAVFAAIAKPATAIVKAAESGDAAAVVTQGSELQSQTAQLVKAMRAVASNTRDPETVKEINQLLAGIESLTPQIITAARYVQQNPNDKDARDNLNYLIAEWEAKVARLQAIADNSSSANDYLAAAQQNIQNEISKAKAAVQAQDKNAFDAASNDISSRASRAAQIARKEIENSDDPEYRKQIESTASALEKNIPTFQASMQKAYNSKNTAEVDQAGNALNQTISSVKTSLGSVDEITLQVSAVQLTQEDRDKEAKLAAEPINSHPIAMAANKLRIVANKWGPVGNPMVKMASSLSDRMRQMATFATTSGSKKELTDNAKAMASDVQEIIKMARAAAENCSDKRLKQNLLQLIDKIPTIAMQLKIIATVKAANPDDKEADAQLITCSQNLMDTVTEIVKGAEAASLKSMKSVANVAVAAVQWKRKAL